MSPIQQTHTRRAKAFHGVVETERAPLGGEAGEGCKSDGKFVIVDNKKVALALGNRLVFFEKGIFYSTHTRREISCVAALQVFLKIQAESKVAKITPIELFLG